ncbi:MAG: hypothetical protein K0U86_00225 [Planctomycetes bacterium]|nr:hypothetical protein [Planctomycetota bacterium]MCH9723311.1 hypothetical protein [Planctomycetota bacterium]MCH9779114.1 hypothetical protein [Planctomycetota bacterium]
MFKDDQKQIWMGFVLLILLCGLTASEAANPFRKSKSSVESLAREIDSLESHIDEYGSVVAKKPDVWGEARLTQHRSQFEQIMAQQLNQFELLLNGNLSRSDQSFLVNALTLSAAASGPQAVVTQPASISTVMTPATNNNTTVVEETLDSTGKVTKRTTTKTGQPAGTPINPPSTDSFTIPTPNFQQQPLLSNAIGFGGLKTSGIGLEPVEELNQLKRYLDHLNQIRRQNEGDDVSDSPGYSINLVRIPVSILPGKKTREGYGAEITITATPVLSEETLPRTFREWVINDLVDELTVPTLRNVDLKTWEIFGKIFTTMREYYKKELNQWPPKEDVILEKLHNKMLVDITCLEKQSRNIEESLKQKGLSQEKIDFNIKNFNEIKNANDQLRINHEIDRLQNEILITKNSLKKTQKKVDMRNLKTELLKLNTNQTAKINLLKQKQEMKTLVGYQTKEKRITKYVRQINSILKARNLLFSANALSRDRRARYSVPGSIRGIVYGRSFNHWNDGGVPSPFLYETSIMVELAKKLEEIQNGKPGRISNTAVRDFLQEELKASYDLLHIRMKANPDIWRSFANQLYKTVRNGQDEKLLQFQLQFARLIGGKIPGEHEARMAPYDYQIQEGLAWCILVESALLNHKLYDDMNRIAKEKNCHCVVADEGMEFYLPGELIHFETKHAFNEYVKCRWPLKVFTVDPISQDQNIGDSFSMRRELQLAASLAFANGKMSARNFSQYSRKIALDSETIALNKTVVGFAHGDNTFGWRFRPRFQSPEIDGNLKTFFQTLAGGPSRDNVLKDHRLEPGIRECVAIIVAPGFVPYVTFDTRSNWYKLTKPKYKEFSLQDNVRLSHDIVNLRRAKSQCLKDEHRYRDGEVYRLMRAVDQLEARLPLQTAYVEMPVDFSKGGFQALSGSLTSLGPELVGFYGEPGYDTKKSATSFFLVGDNFNIMETKVIAGNSTIANTSTNMVTTINTTTTTTSKETTTDTSTNPTQKIRMLSRQVLEVTIPKDLNTYKVKYDGKTATEVIGIRVATPYGVSNVLEIPVIKSSSSSEEIKKAITKHVEEKHVSRYEWQTPALEAQLVYSSGGISDVLFVGAQKDAKTPLLNLKNVSDPNLPKVFNPAIAQLAAWIEATKVDAAGTNTKLAKVTIGPFPVNFSSKKNLAFPLADLKKAIIKAVPTASVQNGEKISSIAVTGYLRFHHVDSAELPIIKLEKPLSIKPIELKNVPQPIPVVSLHPAPARAPVPAPAATKQPKFEWKEAIPAKMILQGGTQYPVLDVEKNAIISVKKPTSPTPVFNFKGWIFLKYNEFQTCRVRKQLLFNNLPFSSLTSQYEIEKTRMGKAIIAAINADGNLPCQLKEIDEIRIVGERTISGHPPEKVKGFQSITISVDVKNPTGFTNPFAPQK